MFRRALDLFPVTPLGLLLAAAAGAGLRFFAFGQSDLVFLVLGWGALALVVVSTLFVLFAAWLVHLRVRREGRVSHAGETDEGGESKHPLLAGAETDATTTTLTLDTRRPAPTGFRLRRFRFLPLAGVEWDWVAPSDVSVGVRERGRDAHEFVEVPRRGVRIGVQRRFVVGDPFGIARVALWRRDARLRLLALPDPGRLRQVPVLTTLSGGDDLPHPLGVFEGDRVELRRYAPGDPARFIHWKVFGRTRKLVVRLPERALTRSRRTVAYLVAAPGDEASAAVARVAIEEGAFGEDWLFGADGVLHRGQQGTRDPGEALSSIVTSAAHAAGPGAAPGGCALGGFLAEAERSGPAAAVVFAPARPGPWVASVVGALARRPGRARVVIGVDGLAARAPTSALRRVLFQDDSAARAVRGEGDDVEALEQVIAAFAKTRAEVLVLDRQSGRTLGEPHRAAVRAAHRPEHRPALEGAASRQGAVA